MVHPDYGECVPAAAEVILESRPGHPAGAGLSNFPIAAAGCKNGPGVSGNQLPSVQKNKGVGYTTPLINQQGNR